MPRFFVAPADVQNGIVTLEGENARHVSLALRLAVGEHITICDGTSVYDCELCFFDGQTVRAEVKSVSPIDTEPPYVVHLYQALPKGDKLDTVIQKAVECGASYVSPFESTRCIVRVKPEAETRKTERRQRIAEEAAKQCGRGIIPAVSETLSWNDMLNRAREADLVLFCYEGQGTRSIREVLDEFTFHTVEGRAPEIAVIIGSEGGFSPEEAASAKACDFAMVGLGRRILRTETASSFVLGCLSYRYEL